MSCWFLYTAWQCTWTPSKFNSILKGVCHEIFDLQFVSWFEPLISRLKYFWIQFRFCRDIQIFKNSTVCIPPWSQTSRCASYRRVRLRSVHPTAESSSAVCISPQSQVMNSSQKTPWCASHRRVKLHCVHHTAESDSTVCIWVSLVAFKRKIRRNPFRGEQLYHVRKDLKKKKFIC